MITLNELLLEVQNCTKCPISQTRRNAVLHDGLPSPLMIVGEGPGENEDIDGIPFTGRAGKFLNSCLEAAGVGREKVYLTNILKCRAHDGGKNRPPTLEEKTNCSSYLDSQVEIVKPLVIVCVGSPSTSVIIPVPVKITVDRGKFFESKYKILALPVLHPAYILRQHDILESLKQELVEDLQLAIAKVKELYYP